MTDIEELVRAAEEANAALLAAEREATEELIAAKAAYRADPSRANRERKAAAVDRIQAIRAAVRKDRGDTPAVGGDAFITSADDMNTGE